MTPVQALVLAAVQGATEFLPVSSSGHLVLVRQILGWSDEGGLLFDIVLHAGSLAAILAYFWRDAFAVFLAFRPSAFPGRAGSAGEADPARAESLAEAAAWRRLPGLVLLATLPAVAAAPFLKDVLESGARTASCAGASMLMTALWFVLAERRAAGRPTARLTWGRALAAGLAQVVALLPGASRSGWTAAAGLLGGLPRVEAVRFAFFMAVPAIAGSLVFDLPGLRAALAAPAAWNLAALGFALSFVFSLAAIHFCLRFFRTRTLRPFALYLAAAGALVLVLDGF